MPNFYGCRCCGSLPNPDWPQIRWYINGSGAPDPMEAWYFPNVEFLSGLLQVAVGEDQFTWTIGRTSGIIAIHWPEEGDEYGDILALPGFWPVYEPPAGAVGTSKGPKEIRCGFVGPITEEVTNEGAFIFSDPVVQLEAADSSDVTRNLTFGPDTFKTSWGQYMFDETGAIDNLNPGWHTNAFGFNYLGGPISPHLTGDNMSDFGELDRIPATLFARQAIVGKLDIEFVPRPGFDLIEVPTGGFWKMFLTQWVGDLPCGRRLSGKQAITDSGFSEWSNESEAADADGITATASGTDQLSDYLLLIVLFNECFDSRWTFTGIELEITRWADEDAGSVYIKDSSLVLSVVNPVYGEILGSNLAATSVRWPTTAGNRTYGGSGSLMGLTAEQVSNSGGVLKWRLQVEHGHNGGDAFVDGFMVTIHYLDENGVAQTTTADHSHHYPPRWGASQYEEGPNDRIAVPGDSSGYTTTFLPEQIPFSIDGAGLAVIVENYLDPRYSVEGEGDLSSGNKITLTFTYVDGPERGVTYDLTTYGFEYFARWFYAFRLVGIGGLVHYPDEVATLHRLDSGNITWSRGALKYSSVLSPTNPDKISCFHEGRVTWDGVRSGSFWEGFQFTKDGGIVDQFGTFINRETGGEYPMVSYRWADGSAGGAAYATKRRGSDSIYLRKYNNSGSDAFRYEDWVSDLADGFSAITESDESFLYVGGLPSSGFCYVACIDKNSGEVLWRTELPNDTIYGTQHAPSQIFSYGGTLFVSANHGVFQLSSSTGEIQKYYPHGARTHGVMVKAIGDFTWVVLIGLPAPRDVPESLYDMLPD